MKWRTAIVGFGSAAEYFHLPSLARTCSFEVVAAFDPVSRRRDKALELGVPYVDDLGDVADALRRNDIQVVVVASPNAEHAANALQGLEAGACVIVEKPVAQDGATYGRIQEAARARGRWLLPFHNRAFDVDHRIASEAVQAGDIGRLLRVDLTVAQPHPWDTYAAPEFDPAWRRKRRWQGGVLNDWGPHLIEQCLRFLPASPTIVAAHLHEGPDREVDVMASLTLVATETVVRILISSCERENSERTRLVGTEGCIVVHGSDAEGTIEVDGVRGRTKRGYLNCPDSGEPIYRALCDAMAGRDDGPARRIADRGQLVYALLGEARRVAGRS